MYEQLTLFQLPAPPARAVYGSGIGQAPALPGRRDSAHMESIYLDRLLPLEEYDKIIVLFSGGKDSLACVLDLLERSVPREKMELWHHDIDGGHPTRKMDWPATQNYVRAVAEYLGISWLGEALVGWPRSLYSKRVLLMSIPPSVCRKTKKGRSKKRPFGWGKPLFWNALNDSICCR